MLIVLLEKNKIKAPFAFFISYLSLRRRWFSPLTNPVLTGHQDNVEFALAMGDFEPFVLSGKDKLVVLWSIHDHVSTLAADQGDAKSPGSRARVVILDVAWVKKPSCNMRLTEDELILAACGLSKKPKKQIVDIDAAYMNNELAILEYVEDIYGFYKLSEPTKAVYPNEATDQLGSRQHNKVFDCSVPIPYVFLVCFIKASLPDSESRASVNYRETNSRATGMVSNNPRPYVFLVHFIKASLPDSEENLIYGKMGTNQVNRLKAMLKEGSLFTIKNFKVVESTFAYRPIESPLTIILSSSTVINNLSEDIVDISINGFQFIKPTMIDSRVNNHTVLSDVNNELAVLEYVEDIYSFYKLAESILMKPLISLVPGYTKWSLTALALVELLDQVEDVISVEPQCEEKIVSHGHDGSAKPTAILQKLAENICTTICNYRLPRSMDKLKHLDRSAPSRENHVSRFKNNLIEGSLFTIKTFKVVESSGVYRPVENSLKIIFFSSTAIKSLSEDIVDIPVNGFHFIKPELIESRVNNNMILSDENLELGYKLKEEKKNLVKAESEPKDRVAKELSTEKETYVVDDVQVQFHTVSPYVRKTMSTDQKGVYYTSFKVPDVYGVFQFKVEYEKLGVISLTLAKIGKDKLIVLWSIHDQVSTLAADHGDAKSLGSGESNPKPSAEGPTIQATDIFQGHDDTVEDVQFCPSREADRSRGFGFVTMSTVEEAEKVVVLYNSYVWCPKTETLCSSCSCACVVNLVCWFADLEVLNTLISCCYCVFIVVVVNPRVITKGVLSSSNLRKSYERHAVENPAPQVSLASTMRGMLPTTKSSNRRDAKFLNGSLDTAHQFHKEERESPPSPLSAPKNGEPSFLHPTSQGIHSLYYNTTPSEQSSDVLGGTHFPRKNDHPPRDNRRLTDNPNNPRLSMVGPNHQEGSERDYPRAGQLSEGSNPSLCPNDGNNQYDEHRGAQLPNRTHFQKLTTLSNLHLPTQILDPELHPLEPPSSRGRKSKSGRIFNSGSSQRKQPITRANISNLWRTKFRSLSS
ncbi:hypothetical protein FXO37_33130 [Capsicum annuum]|nr:hypothetical protein FXO37_33130 [Capsicum annuum]